MPTKPRPPRSRNQITQRPKFLEPNSPRKGGKTTKAGTKKSSPSSVKAENKSNKATMKNPAERANGIARIGKETASGYRMAKGGATNSATKTSVPIKPSAAKAGAANKQKAQGLRGQGPTANARQFKKK